MAAASSLAESRHCFQVAANKWHKRNQRGLNMPTRSIVERLEAREILVLDGGTGSELQRRGVNVDKGATADKHGVWSASANIDAPGIVRQVHEDYLRAGSEVIISNNFYTSRAMLTLIGEEERWEEYTRRGAELAVQARNAVNREAYVAGGITAPILPCDLHKELEDESRVLAKAGVDFMLAEFMGGTIVQESPIADCVTAVDACATAGLPVFLGVSRVKESGTMCHDESFADLVAALKGHKVDGIFLMCSYPEAISASLPNLRKAFDGPIGAYGHVGYEENPKYGTSPDEPYFAIGTREYTAKRYAEFAGQWKEMGAQVIGGCCATRPEHIEAVRKVLRG